MASDRTSNPFSEVLEDILDIVLPLDLNQSNENDIDYDTQFKRAYDQFKDHEHEVYSKLTVLLEADIDNAKETEQKDSQKAVTFREAGNKYFKEEKFAEALSCYNKSIFYAPCPENLEEGGEFVDFALGLVNRN